MTDEKYLLKEKESWEIMAADSTYIKIPSFQDNEFLKLLKKEHMLKKSYDILDIGCGAGVYSIAVKDMIHSALGLDFSENMLCNAKKLIKENNASNITLRKMSWQETDLEKENMKDRFDLVFSHTTPAISDEEALQKMIDSSRKYCVISLFARVNQPVMKEIKRIIGSPSLYEKYNSQRIDRIEKSVTMIFDYLYKNGYYPHIHYEDSGYVFRQSLDSAVKYYTKDAEKLKNLSRSDREKIESFLRSIEKDGYITEDMHPCIVTFYWDKTKRNTFITA